MGDEERLDTSPNWYQLAYDAAHLIVVLGLILLFIWALISLTGVSLSHIGRFFSKAVKAEFTERVGWLDFALFLLFCVFVYVTPIEQDVLEALNLGHLSSEPQLVNPNLRFLGTVLVLLASLLFVGLVKTRPSGTTRVKK